MELILAIKKETSECSPLIWKINLPGCLLSLSKPSLLLSHLYNVAGTKKIKHSTL